MGALPLPDEFPALPPVAYEGMSVEEYFAFEEQSKEKHDYWNGKLYAMAGSTINHNRIVSNGIHALRNALDNGTCEVFPGNLRVQAHAMNIYTYPDITVLCEEPDFYNNRKTPSLILACSLKSCWLQQKIMTGVKSLFATG